MNDRDFLSAFYNGTLNPEEFRHRGHLRLAWLVLQGHDLDEAIQHISSGIRKYASSKGATAMYNETLTQFWIRIVNDARQTNPPTQEFEEFISEFPALANTRLPYFHWRPETLNGSHARSRWLTPDLTPLPF